MRGEVKKMRKKVGRKKEQDIMITFKNSAKSNENDVRSLPSHRIKLQH